MAKYRIRATSLSVYYSDVDSDDYPDLFDEEGNPKTPYYLQGDGLLQVIGNPDDDLFDRTFNYGVEPDSEDWVWTDFTKVKEEN